LPLAVALMMVALLPTPALANISCVTDIYTANATPSAQSVQQGTTASYLVTVTEHTLGLPYYPSNIFSTLSVTGLPAGFTATFTANGYNLLHEPIGQLAVQTTTGHLGTYPLQITGPNKECIATLGNDFTLTVTDTTDTTAPTTTATLAGTKGTNPWYTSAVTVTLAATDPDGTSDVATTTDTVDGVAKPTYTAPFTVSGDGTHPVTFSSTDKAGNAETSQTLTVTIDATAPSGVTGAPDRAPDSNGWYNHAVTVMFSGTDATSGIATCTSTTYSGPDSATATVSGTCTDKAGNVSAPATFTFTYGTDTTAPTTTAALSGTKGNNGYYTSAVTVTLAATDPDGISDVATTTDTVDSGAAQAYTAPFTVSGDGSHPVTFSSTDKAGNAETTKTQTIKIDATAPTNVVGTPDRGPDAGGYYNHPVTVTFAGKDATSGIATCTSATYSGPESATVSVPGSCTDTAGNSASGSVALKYDTTPR